MSKDIFNYWFFITLLIYSHPILVLSNRVMKNRFPFNPELSMTAADIIRHRGYPVETHSVTTEDGYILELRRIPSRLKPNNQAKPIFLMYGFLGSDAVWSIAPANRSLPYILSDRGYDVWMGNSRGNTYSRKHVTLNPEESQYWDYSWDEMGRFDIPASILYILKTTEQEKLSYIGNSFGCTLFFLAMASQPELNKHIDIMIGLAPVSTMDNMNVASRIISSFWNPIQTVLKLLGVKNVGDIPTMPLFPLLQRLTCETTYPLAAICRELMFFNIGSNRENFDLTSIPMINKVVPDGMSLKTVTHFVQHTKRDGSLNKFDYGKRENLKRYGSPLPPAYDLSLVTAPVYLFWAGNDKVATSKDVVWLASKLGNLKGSIQVPDPKFNHFDFLIGYNVYSVLYSTIISLLPDP